MSTSEGRDKAPKFDGKNYGYWKIRMAAYIKSINRDAWNAVLQGYTPPDGDMDQAEKTRANNDAKAVNALLSALDDTDLSKVIECESAKQIWDKLKSLYEGDPKVKEAKLQIFRAEYESLKMTDDESVSDYLQRVNEIVVKIKGFGEEVSNANVVKKVLRTLTTAYDSKVSAIEEAKDLNTLTWDELLGSLVAYEMRAVKDKPEKIEEAFKGKAQIGKTGKGNSSNFVRGGQKRDGYSNNGNRFQNNRQQRGGFQQNNLRGGGRIVTCHRCNKPGHIARDCWTDMRDQHAKVAKNRGKGKGKLRSDDESSSDGEALFMAEAAAIPYDYSSKEKSPSSSSAAEDDSDEDNFDGNVYDEDYDYTPDDIKLIFEDNNWLGKEYRKYMKGEIRANARLEKAQKKIAELKQQKTKLTEELRVQNDKFDSVFKELQKLKMEKSSKSLENLIKAQLPASHTSGLGFVAEKASTSNNKSKTTTFVKGTDGTQYNLSEAKKAKRVPTAKPAKPAARRNQKATVSKSQFQFDFDTNIFFGTCNFCGMYGHKLATCKFYAAKQQIKPARNHNRFGVLNKVVDCYACGEYGHVAANCFYQPPKSADYHGVGAYHSRIEKQAIRCYKCNEIGHVAKKCKAGDLNELIMKKIREHIQKTVTTPTSPTKEKIAKPAKQIWMKRIDSEAVSTSGAKEYISEGDSIAFEDDDIDAANIQLSTFRFSDDSGSSKEATQINTSDDESSDDERPSNDTPVDKGKQKMNDSDDDDGRNSLRSSCEDEEDARCLF